MRYLMGVEWGVRCRKHRLEPRQTWSATHWP